MILQSQLLVFRQSKRLLRIVNPFDHSLKVYGQQILTLTILPVLHVDLKLSVCYSKRFLVLSETALGVLEHPDSTCILEYHQRGVNRFRVGVCRLFLQSKQI
jgi:hypothetical protein